ncbi:hypothetical protein BABINDRAFT_163076 [Babjeviella inositovora NRRL Y-12698]|uniref:RCC1-like domain-containing protein n=1 Tax=Babjeviella inositovora NRRL Y-12698 TaxID=984486 RepID=A0A1E3QK18_9ASCO|nr:uncharacterized protein BABINDRAFT_163076 [Babjeviella inositovora NRRL Y-12698]ODQ78039.1 hypothetical protein BABINDRAFT_163076 [Babjeviella inositovora NRRL Y-12698]
MVALNRKKRAASEEKSAVPKAKRARSKNASVLRLTHLPEINPLAVAKTEILDVFVFGTGSMCELGLGPEAKTKEVKRPRLNPFLGKDSVGIVDIAVGGMHTLALDKNGNIWSWGGNDSGVLGRDTTLSQEQLRDMDDDSDDEDGDLNAVESTPAKVEGLPEDVTVVQIAATDNLSACLTSAGDVYTWGTFRCNEGELGYSQGIKVQLTPARMETLSSIVQLAPGKDHIMALDTRGLVYAWGNGQQHQLGRRVLDRFKTGALEPREFGLRNIMFIGSGEFHSFAITHTNKVMAWGLNQYGQCGIPIDLKDESVVTKPTVVVDLLDKEIVNITGGEHHSIALAKDGSVYTFGRYDMKEVGIAKSDLPEGTFRDEKGNARSVPIPTKLVLPKCKAVAAGSHHTLAVTEDGLVFTWGFADTYAVGLGNTEEDVEVPTRINNTATKFYDIKVIGGGGQFSVSGGVKMDEDEAEDRNEKYD